MLQLVETHLRWVWGGIRCWRHWRLKVSGADNGRCVQGHRAGRRGGTVAPQKECAGLSGNSSTRLPSWPTAPQWAPLMAAAILSHVVESLEWPKGAEAEGGAGSLGVPGSLTPLA